MVFLALSGSAVAADPWVSFWQSVSVNPPPPRDFLDGEFDGKIENLTIGRLADSTVKAWVLADLRRGRGDAYAAQSLRRDIADAGVFGPPGLNGTSEGIDALRRQGVVRISSAQEVNTLAAGVIWISPQLRQEHPGLGLTEYVIVLAYRRSASGSLRVFRDGRTEPLPSHGEPGEVRWQLDTGHFVDHATLGPLWYQQQGWSCHPGDGTTTGEICARLRP